MDPNYEQIIDRAIDILIRESHNTAKEKGWWDESRSFGELIALMHSELSEALEVYRKEGDEKVAEIYPGYIEGVPIEIADLLIRVFDMCGKYNIDLAKALIIKMEYNKTRPYRHGGKII